jgi:hypothetical protein
MSFISVASIRSLARFVDETPIGHTNPERQRAFRWRCPRIPLAMPADSVGDPRAYASGWYEWTSRLPCTQVERNPR